jgi:opacity protein-like surface antigen
MKSIVKACLAWGALSLTPASAADLISATALQDSPVAQAGWTYSVTPYFWAAGLSGQTSQFNLPVVDIDASFTDIFDHLDFAAMVMGEARHDRFSVFGDVMYTKLSTGAATPRGIAATSVDLDASTFAGLAGVGYSVIEGAAGRLDVVGAVRVWSVDTEISFSGAFLNGQSRSDSATWVDGLVGVRGTYNFNPKFYAFGWGLVGAGGADVDWDVMAGVGYNINESLSATLGYRALGVDYSDDGFLFDVVEQGPMAGLTVRF